MGMHADLTEATKIAVREMIDFLMSEKHLNRDDAYIAARASPLTSTSRRNLSTATMAFT